LYRLNFFLIRRAPQYTHNTSVKCLYCTKFHFGNIRTSHAPTSELCNTLFQPLIFIKNRIHIYFKFYKKNKSLYLLTVPRRQCSAGHSKYSLNKCHLIWLEQATQVHTLLSRLQCLPNIATVCRPDINHPPCKATFVEIVRCFSICVAATCLVMIRTSSVWRIKLNLAKYVTGAKPYGCQATASLAQWTRRIDNRTMLKFPRHRHCHNLFH